MTIPFDARVLRPNGEWAIYCADVYESGFVGTRGNGKQYYWCFGGRVLVPKDGVAKARLVDPISGEVASDRLDQSAVKPGLKIEVWHQAQATWVYAGTILEALPTIQSTVLDDK